jgi:putative transcriptional regulator
MYKASNLKNQFLIAMPRMEDPNFNHTVTLICQQNHKMGAFGLIINRPSSLNLGELFEQLNINIEDPSLAIIPALTGGPVQPEQGFVLHDTDKSWESTLPITDELALTSSRDILVDIAKGEGPKQFLLTLGCAGWAPGQLEKEIQENTWLTCPANENVLFDLPYKHRWQGAADTLGIDLNLISHIAGHA